MLWEEETVAERTHIFEHYCGVKVASENNVVRNPTARRLESAEALQENLNISLVKSEERGKEVEVLQEKLKNLEEEKKKLRDENEKSKLIHKETIKKINEYRQRLLNEKVRHDKEIEAATARTNFVLTSI
jgi:hypothetical protein